jgi:hypothetical protein
MTNRKQRVDSTAAAKTLAARAHDQIIAPSHIEMDDSDKRFFANIVQEFARASWTQHQLELAAFLARAMSDLELEQRMLRSEGSTIRTERGTPVINPRRSAVQLASMTILSMRRSLSLHGRAKEGEAGRVADRRAAQKAIEDGVRGDLDDDSDLIPNASSAH